MKLPICLRRRSTPPSDPVLQQSRDGQCGYGAIGVRDQSFQVNVAASDDQRMAHCYLIQVSHLQQTSTYVSCLMSILLSRTVDRRTQEIDSSSNQPFCAVIGLLPCKWCQNIVTQIQT